MFMGNWSKLRELWLNASTVVVFQYGWAPGRQHALVYLSDAKSCDVLAVRGGAVASPPQGSQDAADALHGYAPVYGVIWRRRGAG